MRAEPPNPGPSRAAARVGMRAQSGHARTQGVCIVLPTCNQLINLFVSCFVSLFFYALSTVRERPRSRPGRVRAGRYRSKMAPHSAGRGECGTFTPNQRFLRRSVIWACLPYYGNRHDAARKSADGAHGQGLRSQSPTAFARDLISENGFFRKSFARQTRRSIEACSLKKKKNEKEKHFFRQAWHFCCTPTRASLLQALQRTFAASLVTALQTAVVRTSPRQVERANCT